VIAPVASGPRPGRRSLAVALVVAALGVVAARLCQVALVDGERLADLARRQHVVREELRPIRGTILDRSGETLAVSVGADSVFVRPRQLPRDDDRALAALGRTLGIPRQTLFRKISGPARFVWLKRPVSSAERIAVAELDVPGVGMLAEPRRFYPHGPLAAAVIGFAGIDSQGLEGVERVYDRELRGPEQAVGVERDALGRRILLEGEAEGPRRGADVELTLDSAVEYVAERELDRQVMETGARGGLVVILDPRTGELLALAQNPSFDPNRVAAARPDDWRNRVVADAYEPGSTLKGVLAAAALEEGAVVAGERFFCEEGSHRVAGEVIHDHHPHGWLSFPQVFQLSSNICAAKIGARLGADRYHDLLVAFGFGGKSGVDLSGEQAGIVRPARAWKPIDVATASFGQGIAVTPMQLASAYATLANGGVRMRPYVVRRVVSEDGEVVLENAPRIVRRVVREETARQVTAILEGVVGREGTAPAAAIPGVRVAGKTGTAQKVDLARGGYAAGRVASFVGYLPAEDPRVVILVIIDEPRTTRWGGTAAAPVFRAVAEATLGRFGIERSPALEGDDREPAIEADRARDRREAGGAGDPGEDASFVGLSLREALERARRAGVAVEVVGSGYVVRQRPTAAPGSGLRLELAGMEGPIT
jgi:cell division protein FtsI (penicillin-binding protein 3)